MAENKMLIDATHPEETRVVVLREGRVEEFDYESAARKLLRGSIFLAKITRVEPSLQAAFVDYGGNRHGFLAFNEIHPDYYQIPHADRLALIEEESAEQKDDSDDDAAADAGGEDIVADDMSEHDMVAEAEQVDEAQFDDDDGAVQPATEAKEIDDPEGDAIDVTHLLPPEPTGDDGDTVAAAEADDAETGDEPAEDGATDKDADDSNSGSKTIAAATSPDERIVSDVVEVTETAGDEAVAEVAGDVGDDAAMAEAGAAEATNETAGKADEERQRDQADDTAQEDMNDADDEVALEAEEAVDEDDEIDDVGNTDVMEEVPARRRRRARNYKIQEVIKRRQVVLVQVVKEERGNKGAALTTYLSLAGRYTVLMPNTARGGGISRKITNIQDRKRLKAIAQELDVPDGMGLIIRTAGAARTKQEIKRDFEYLLRLWENVRDLTLQSTAPSLVYEEGDLIKRSIRDLYSKDVEQVLVAGEDSHKEAKSFMRMLMPSHAKNVVKYEDPQPLFARYRIEQQLNAMFSPFVQLKSGGYLVINQAEALVAVDVNSGKSTRKFSIEDTALNTNLEAAEELARQLKLRDLAGLIVIDFIDMEEKRNNRAVERRLKECLRDDRARIQVGRISHFGLLEMSRQRLRTGVLEGSTMPCQHCQGTGIIRSTESVALAVLRALEDNLMSGSARPLTAHCSRDVAMYLLNQKRTFVQDIEARYGVAIKIEASDEQQGADFLIERGSGGPALPQRVDRSAVNVDSGFTDERDDSREGERSESEERRPRRRRRRRGRRSDTDIAADTENGQAQADVADDADDSRANGDSSEASTNGASDNGEAEERNGRRRRRGRRGGRRNRGDRPAAEGVAMPGAPQPDIGASEPAWSKAAVPGDGGAQASAEEAASAADDDGRERAPAAEDGGVTGVDQSVAEAIETVTFHVGSTAAAEHDDNGSTVADGAAEETHDDEAVAEAGDAQGDRPDDAAVTAEADTDKALIAEAEAEAEVEAAEPVQANGQEPSEDAGEDTAASPRGEPVASEPVLERIVLTPMADGDASDGEGSDTAPARKGWWQRRFGA